MKTYVIIPARGGSKSIPRKNIKSFAGKPLIAYSIEAGLAAKHVDRVIVSTDDDEIAAISKALGAEVPFIRPSEIALDYTTDLAVFQHIHAVLKPQIEQEDIFIQMRPTTPIRPVGLIDDALACFKESTADSLRSVSEAEPTPFKMWKNVDGLLQPLLDIGIHESYNLPRQQLPITYWHNGLIDIFPARTLTEQNSLTGNKILPYEIDRKYCFDLDTILQWQYAEYMFEKMRFDEEQ